MGRPRHDGFVFPVSPDVEWIMVELWCTELVVGAVRAVNHRLLAIGRLKEIQKLGGLDLFDTFIYHGYAQNPDSSYARVEGMKAVAVGTTVPVSARSASSSMASENKEGTGGCTSWPASTSHCKPSPRGEPPVVTAT